MSLSCDAADSSIPEMLCASAWMICASSPPEPVHKCGIIPIAPSFTRVRRRSRELLGVNDRPTPSPFAQLAHRNGARHPGRRTVRAGPCPCGAANHGPEACHRTSPRVSYRPTKAISIRAARLPKLHGKEQRVHESA